MRYRPGASVLPLLACLPLLAQTQPQQHGFTEKVEVNVRTVLAVVTDAKGKPIERPLTVEDVEVLEDGIPAKVLGVDAVRPAKTAGSTAGKALPRTEISPAAPPEVIARVPQILYLDASLLQKQSVMTVPLAIGGNESFFANSPSTVGKRSFTDLRNPVNDAPTLLFARPLDPLRQVADATGGEVVTREDGFVLALDRLSNAVAITYRMERPPDGREHSLEVRSRREGVVIRTAHSVVAGTPETAAATRSIDAFTKPGAAGSLPIKVGVDLIEVKKNKRRVGELRVSADLLEIAGALEKVGPGRIRVTVAVEAKGSKPFVHHDEMDIPRDDTGTTWLYDAPFEWPPEAERAAVTIEELKTGASGTAVTVLPTPAIETVAPTAPPGMLSSSPAGPELPLEITFRDVKRSGNDITLRLHAKIGIEPIFEALSKKGRGRIQVIIVSESPAGRTQLANFERSVPFDITVDNWTMEIPVTCSVNATRLMVTLAELESGGHAVASVDPAGLR